MFQLVHGEAPRVDRMRLGERKLEALEDIMFNGRGGRLPLVAFGMVPTVGVFKELCDVDRRLHSHSELPLRASFLAFWRGACLHESQIPDSLQSAGCELHDLQSRHLPVATTE